MADGRRTLDALDALYVVFGAAPQESVLGPLLFLIYINHLIDTCGTYSKMYVFADDAKFFWHIVTADNCNSYQQAVDALQIWSRKLLLHLNIKKMPNSFLWKL